MTIIIITNIQNSDYTDLLMKPGDLLTFLLMIATMDNSKRVYKFYSSPSNNCTVCDSAAVILKTSC